MGIFNLLVKNLTNNAIQLIKCLVELSSNREREDLEQSLVQTLVQLLDTRVNLIRLRDSNGTYAPSLRWTVEGHKHEVVQTGSQNKALSPMMLKRIKKYLDLYEAGKTDPKPGTHFWPLEFEKQLINLIVLPEVIINEDNQQFLTAISTIYGNYLTLLKAGEKDALTGLYNRRVFDTRLASLTAKTREKSRKENDRRVKKDNDDNFLAIIDIDHFKLVNDNFGHLFGDEVLLWLAQMMGKCFRSEDALFRYGGEEFAVLLSELDLGQAKEVLERFKEKVSVSKFPQLGSITVSVGYTRIGPDASPIVIFGEADQALYYAKQNGRNRVDNYQYLVEHKLIQELKNDEDVEFF